MAFIKELDGEITGFTGGVQLVDTALKRLLANIPGPPDGDASGHRVWIANRSFVTLNDSGLTQWEDARAAGDTLTMGVGHTAPTKTQAINSQQTLTFAGATSMFADTFELNADRNTIYVLHKPTTLATLHALFGPGVNPTPGAPTDDVLALGYSSGVPRLLTDAGNASLLISSGDYRDVAHVIRATMSPEHGKAIKINDGDVETRNVALTTALTETSLVLASFGTDTGGQYEGAIALFVVLAGQDMSDDYFTAVDAEIIAQMMTYGGVA